jgi:hypothetical protein
MASSNPGGSGRGVGSHYGVSAVTVAARDMSLRGAPPAPHGQHHDAHTPALLRRRRWLRSPLDVDVSEGDSVCVCSYNVLRCVFETRSLREYMLQHPSILVAHTMQSGPHPRRYARPAASLVSGSCKSTVATAIMHTFINTCSRCASSWWLTHVHATQGPSTSLDCQARPEREVLHAQRSWCASSFSPGDHRSLTAVCAHVCPSQRREHGCDAVLVRQERPECAGVGRARTSHPRPPRCVWS